MDDKKEQLIAVVFDWTGTLTQSDLSVTPPLDKPIDGAKEFIAELRQKGIAVFIATGGYFDEEMLDVGFEDREIIHCESGYKGKAIDQLRGNGFQRIVYVGDSEGDVENPATREVPVIIFEPKIYTGESKQRMDNYRRKQMDNVRLLVDGVDVSDANGIDELREAVSLTIDRAHLPTKNKTQIRSFGDNAYAAKIAQRFVEILHEGIDTPIFDRTKEDSAAQNVPKDRGIVVSTSSFSNGRSEAFQIDVEYTLDIPQKDISVAVESINAELRTQGVFGPYSGLQTVTRYPDRARPDIGRDLG